VRKARANRAKHGVNFADAVGVFFGSIASTIPDLRQMEERFVTRGLLMKTRYSFKGGKRGSVANMPPGKTRITIRLDNDILDGFRERADAARGANYQTMINQALREYVTQDAEELEETLRRVVREELNANAG